MKKNVLRFLILIVAFVFAGCAPPRFPQLNERRIAGPGIFLVVQWRPDGQYISFMKTTRTFQELVMINLTSGEKNTLVPNVNGEFFTWLDNDNIAYLLFSSGNEGPELNYDLHVKNIITGEDRIVAKHLKSVSDFNWLSEDEIILVMKGNSGGPNSEIYIVNSINGNIQQFLAAQQIGYKSVSKLALSKDRTVLAFYAIGKVNQTSGLLAYDLKTHALLKEIKVGDIFPPNGVNYPKTGLGDDTNFNWVGGNQWILDKMYTPAGKCYNYALVFLDMQAPENSICIPSAGGPFSTPTISPDLKKLAYISVVGPREYYVMVADTPEEFLNALGK